MSPIKDNIPYQQEVQVVYKYKHIQQYGEITERGLSGWEDEGKVQTGYQTKTEHEWYF